MARSSNARAGWAVVALAALAAVGYATHDTLTGLLPLAVDDATAPSVRDAQPVRVTQVVYASPVQLDSYTGTIRPQHEAPLGFRLPGKLIARLVDVGDTVTAGQIVARLNDADARLELALAEAELTAARADQTRAKADLARNRELFATGHVAQTALDRATSAAAEARSRADRAAQMQALATNQLSYMDLVAEADGIVTASLAEPGQVVDAAQPVLTVAQTDTLEVVFAPQEQQRDLAQTAVASAVIWGESGTTYPLVLRDISPDVDAAGRTYRVRMTITAPDMNAALGRTVTVRLATTGALPAASLPLAAVQNDGAGTAVWRLPRGAETGLSAFLST